jgi:hypothetical protein
MLIVLPLLTKVHPVLESYRAAAKQETPTSTDFSATRGDAFYRAKTGDTSCASCHSDSPRTHGKQITSNQALG